MSACDNKVDIENTALDSSGTTETLPLGLARRHDIHRTSSRNVHISSSVIILIDGHLPLLTFGRNALTDKRDTRKQQNLGVTPQVEFISQVRTKRLNKVRSSPLRSDQGIRNCS